MMKHFETKFALTDQSYFEILYKKKKYLLKIDSEL